MPQKIKNVQDVKAVCEKILTKLVGQHGICYFNLLVAEGSSISNAYFTPTAPTRKKLVSFMGVQDYEKLLMLLLSHEKCEDLEYHKKQNMLVATFYNPFWEELLAEEEAL